MTAEIAGVLFDFGNTLFGHDQLAATFVAAGARLGHRFTSAEAADLAARVDAMAADPAERAHPRDLDDAVWAARWRRMYAVADDRCAGLGEAVYAAMHDPLQWIPFLDTAAVLAALHERDVRVGVVSNTGWDVRAAFAARGLDDCVDAFLLSYEVGVVKPDPRMFGAALDALGCSAVETLMVGDDATADAGAARAGLRTLLLPPVAPGGDNGVGIVVDLVDAGRSARDRQRAG